MERNSRGKDISKHQPINGLFQTSKQYWHGVLIHAVGWYCLISFKYSSGHVNWWGWAGIVSSCFYFPYEYKCVFQDVVFVFPFFSGRPGRFFLVQEMEPPDSLSNSSIKPNSENSTQTIFPGGSPWATQIVSRVIAGVFFSVPLFLGVLAPFSWHPPLVFLCGFFEISMFFFFFWDRYGVSMIQHGLPKGCLTYH